MSISRHHWHRSASFLITLFGIISNFAVAVQVVAAWSLKWEPESEWESSRHKWLDDSVKVLWGLVTAYFAVSAAVCCVGFVGVVKSKPVLVRFYRDYCIADVVFSAIVLAAGIFGAFQTAMRTGLCEELTQQPDLMRNLTELGLSVDNCERWVERAVMAFLFAMVITLVIRLHVLLAVSNFYAHLSRHAHHRLPQHHHSRSHSNGNKPQDLQRILLIPRAPASASAPTSPDTEDAIVYAPVRLGELPPEAAQEMRKTAMEAWVKHSSAHGQKHHRSVHRSTSPGSQTGRIRLPLDPEEGLLPAYYDDVKA